MRWFKHDSDANTDAKLIKVRHKYGMVGYGLYWYCLELIARNVSANNITFELEHDSETIAMEWGLDQLKVQEIMEYMVDLRLFEESGGRITCLKLAFRLDDTNAKNPEIKKIQEQIRNNSEKLRETPKVSGQIRLDENRLEKSKGRFTPPTTDEVREYCKERGNAVDPQRFVDHYEANGWFRGKTKMKDWKAAVRTWEKSEPKQERYGEGGI